MTDLPSLLVFCGTVVGFSKISGIKVGFLQDQWTRLSQSTFAVVPSLGSAPPLPELHLL